MEQIRSTIFAAVAALAGITAPATAAVMTKSYVTTATFTNAPISAVSLTYRLTFDPAALFPGGTISNYTATPNFGAFSGPVGAEFRFGGTVVIGKSPSGIDGTAEGTDDFVARFSYDSSGNPIADSTQVYFTRAGGDGTFFSTTASTATADVPEPATWGLMVLGFGTVGFGLRRRRVRTVLA